MSDVNANIGVQIDTSLALAELKNLQRQLANFHSAVSKSSAAAALAQKNLQNNLVNSINETGKFRAQMGVIRTSTESFTDALEKNKFSMREYFRYAGASSKTFGRTFRSEFETINKVATERVKDLQTQYIKLGRDATGAMRAIAVRPLALDMENYATKTQLAAQRQALFNQLVKQGSTNLLNFGKNTQWAGRQLMVGFSIPLAYLGTAAAKTFMQIEEQAVRFKRVYGEMFTPSEETDKVLQDVRQLAKEFTRYGVAVEDTLKVAADAAAAGKMGADLIAQVQEATRLAVLGQVEQAQALETTISLSNAFGSSAEQLAKDINFLNAVENQTVVGIEDLTIAIPKAGPVVKQLGGDVKDLAYFLTAMKEGGINASEGANALKSGLASLINPTEKASAMLLEMGVNIKSIVEDNKGNLRATVEDFAAALDTLAPLERARAIEQLFGKFQFARLSTLFENVAKEGTQAARVLKLAGASVEELAILSERELKAVEDSIGVDFKEAVQKLRLALEPIGKMFLKVITPIAKTVADLLGKFNNLDEGTQKFIIGITTLVGVIGPTLLMTFGLIANGAANIIKLFLAMRNGFLKVSGDSKILGEQTQYMTTEQAEAATVAAALNQAHNRLVQTFTSETTAVMALRKAYTDATLAAARFAAANPGMMSPTTGGKKPKKYAKGITRVPGSGNKDTVPSLLTPGEGVVPADIMKNPEAQVLLQALIEGKLFKYSGGTALAGESFAHVGTGSARPIDEILRNQNLTPAQRQKLEVYKDILVANNMKPEARAFHGLAYSFPQDLNARMYRGIGLDEFERAWTRSGPDKWISSGIPASEAAIVDKEMLKKIKSYGATTVSDAVVERAFKELPDHVKATPAYTKMSRLYGDLSAFAVGKGLGSIPSTTRQVLEQAKRAGMIDDYKITDRVDSKGKVVNSSIVVFKNGKPINLGRGADAERSNISKRKGKETVAVETGEKKVSKTGKETRLGAGTTKPKPTNVKPSSGSIRDNRTTTLDEGDRVMSRRDAGRRRRFKVRGLVDGDLTPAQRLAGSEGISLNKAKKIIAEQEKYASAIQASTKEQLNLKDRVKAFSAKANVATAGISGLAIAASFAGGKVGEMAQSIMPLAFAAQGISAILPMLTNPWGILVAGVIASGALIWKFSNDLKKARQAGKELADAMTLSAKDLEDLGAMTGSVAASQIMDRRRKNILAGGITEPQRQFGQNVVESDYGKRLLGNVETMGKSGMSQQEIAKNLSNQLGQAMLEGVINMSEAQGIASALGEKLGSYEIPLNITGNLNQIFGPNGENLKNEPLQVALEIKKQSMEQQSKAFQTALSQRKPESDAANNALKVGGVIAGAMAVTASTGGLAGPAALAVSVAALTKAAWDQNKVKAANLKLDTAAIQLGVESVAQGQDLIDSINVQYDNKVKLAKTDAEIKDIEDQRKKAIDAINVENAKTLDLLIQQKDQLSDGAFDAAIKAAADAMYKEGPMAVFKDQAIEALEGLKDSDFKAQLQLGFASGDIDPLTLTNILNMAANNKPIQKDIAFLIKTEGFADMAVLMQMLNSIGLSKDGKAVDPLVVQTLLSYVNSNKKSFDEDMEIIQRLSDMKRAYGITLDMKTNGIAKMQAADTALQQIKNLPPTITKEALMKANTDGQFNDVIAKWEQLSKGEKEINTNLIVNYRIGAIDSNLQAAAKAAGLTVAQFIAKGFTPPPDKKTDETPTPGPKKERDTSLDDLLKRLRAVRDANIDVTKGIGLLTSKFKKSGGEGWKAFKGIENAMLNINSVGRNREFIDFLSGLDKKAYASYVNMDKLKKGVFQLTTAGKALEMAFNDVKIGEYVTAQQDAVKSSNAQRIAFNNLVKSGMDASLAMEVVADAEMAVAINAKAAKGELKKVTAELTRADEVLKRNAFIEFLNRKDIDIARKLKLASVVPQMKALGMSAESIQDALDNPTIADGLISGLRNGQIEASTLLRLLDQMERERRAKIIIDIETRGQMPVASDQFSAFQSSFNELYNAASNLVDLKYADDIKAVEDAYAASVKAADDALSASGAAEGGKLDQEIAKREANIETIEGEISAKEANLDATNRLIDAKQKQIDAAQREIDAIDDVIEGYQKEIDKLQRKIEIEFDRPIEELQDAIGELERQIEIDFSRPIEVLQEESSDLSNDLTLIDKAAEEVNKKYDAQAKALEKVQKVNEQIINQQKQQIGLADALTQGDISAAAQIMQDMRAANAQASAGSMTDALQAAREAEINGLRSASGMTREQIEKRQFEISQQIFALEEKREAKQLQIRNIQDSIYKLEQGRKVILDQIRSYEDQIYQQNLLKEPIIAKIKQYEKEMYDLRVLQQAQEEAIQKIKETRLKDEEKLLAAAEKAKAAAEKAHQEAMRQAEAKKQADLKAIEEKKRKEMEALDELKAKIDLQAAALALAAFQGEKLPALIKEASRWGYELANALGSIFSGVDLTIPADLLGDGTVPGAGTNAGTGGALTGGGMYGLDPNDPDYQEKVRARAFSGTNPNAGTGIGAAPTGTPTGSKMGLLQGFIELEKQQKAILTMIKDLDVEITKQKVKQFENTKETNKLLELIEDNEKDLLELYTLQEGPLTKLLDLHKLITKEIETQRKYVGDMLDVKNRDYGLFWIHNWWEEIRKLLLKIVFETLVQFRDMMIKIVETFMAVQKAVDSIAAQMQSIASSAASALASIMALNTTVTTTHIINTVYTSTGDPNAGGGTGAGTGDGSALTGEFNKGGLVKPLKMAVGGTVPGPNVNADVIPAMLTPGEFVINREATSKFLPLLTAMNSGGFMRFNSGGLVGGASTGSSISARARASRGGSFGQSIRAAQTPNFSGTAFGSLGNVSIPTQAGKSEVNNQVNAPVYNYSVNVSVAGTNADPNAIANVVLSKIQNMEAQQIRGQATYVS
jgi:TP901 family phage tail tape measure protein